MWRLEEKRYLLQATIPAKKGNWSLTEEPVLVRMNPEQVQGFFV